MASEFQGPILTKKRGGLNRRNPSTDAVFGLVCGGVTTSAYDTLGEIVELKQPADADALGITAAYDANNDILVRHHIDRFFHYAPDGTLFLKIVAQDTTLTEITDHINEPTLLLDLFTNDLTRGKVWYAGCVLNPTNSYSPTETADIDADVVTAVAKAQALVAFLQSEHKLYVGGVMLEGRMKTDGLIANLPDLSTQAAENVSVVIGADADVAARDAMYAKYAEVGSALGMLAVRKVSESIGSLIIANVPEAKASGAETYSLRDVARGYWLTPQLSNGKKFSALSSTEQTALRNKRYIYAGRFSGLDFVGFNDGHTCIAFSDDYAYISDNRIWAKAATLVRAALLPLIRSEVEVDATTGRLSQAQVKYYEQRAQNALTGMVTDGELAGTPVVTIDPAQDVASTSTVALDLAYVRNGILRNLNGTIGVTSAATV